MNNHKNIAITLIIFLLACGCIWFVSQQQLNGLWTRDGRVRAEVITLAGEVDGYLVQMKVKDNQRVKKGDLLFIVDDRDYQMRADASQQTLLSKKYEMDRLRQMYSRRHGLAGTAISKEDVSNSGLAWSVAQAEYEAARQENHRDKLNLNRTKIYAPADGYITNLMIHTGDYVSPGKTLVSIIKDNSFYIYAYFQEDQIEEIKPGQLANITLLNNKMKFSGRVDSISRGILDYSNKSSQGELHDVNPTFDWVRLPMRIPVRIAIPPEAAHYRDLIAGMTCTVAIEDKS